MSSAATESAAEVVMPQMGVSVVEGTIAGWLKEPGERVAADEPICEVSTDKIDVEIPAPCAGLLSEVLVEVGATVAVGTILARITTNAREGGAPDGDAPVVGPPEPSGYEHDRSRFHSPVVRRIAAEHGVDLDSVEGHGVGNRIRKADLLAHLRRREAAAGGNGADRPLHTESPYVAEPEPEPERTGSAPAAGEADLFGPVRREPLGGMRRAIAEHMLSSRRTSAHCTTVVEADFSAVERELGARREALARRGVPLTYLAFVAEAVVVGLQEHPVLNASIDGGEIVHHEDVNLAIAVAIDEGLVAPVIRRAQRLSVEGLAAAIDELARRARTADLAPDDLVGGTFTITNPGRFGALIATPIINQPQVGILDLEAVVRRPVATRDDRGDEAVAIRPMSYLCMSWDHRALDGVEAARFLGGVRQRIEGGGR
jgi:pyruvate/2-oxoglutarate dehydrogenase complex dihydrolipoamide acyltransferase (E2) component